jgi:hypothetical protein
MAYLGIDPQNAYSTYRNIDDISGSFDGTTTTFALKVGGMVPTIVPINEQQVLINVGGVAQQPDPSGAKGFKLNAGNIVFSSAPSAGESFWGVILATANYISANTRFSNGSAALPSITFAADVTTGIYSPGVGQLALSTGGTGKLFVDNSGRVLVGTSAASGSSLLQVAGDAQVQSLNGGSLGGMRNRLINGQFRVDQRGNGAAQLFSNSTGYAADRWHLGCTAGAGTGAITTQAYISTDVPLSSLVSCLKLTVSTSKASSSAADAVYLYQLLEGILIDDFGYGSASAKTATLSFWVKASITGTFSGVIRTSPTALTFRTYAFTYSISAANAWQKVAITVPGDTVSNFMQGASLAMTILFDLGAGSNLETTTTNVWQAGNFTRVAGTTRFLGATAGATMQFSGVQFELGSVATSFEKLSVTQEVDLCFRYYYIPFSGGYTVQAYGGGPGASTYAQIWFPVSMRAFPVINATWSSGVNAAAGSFSNLGTTGATAQLNSVTAGDYAAVLSWFSFDAEF